MSEPPIVCGVCGSQLVYDREHGAERTFHCPIHGWLHVELVADSFRPSLFPSTVRCVNCHHLGCSPTKLGFVCPSCGPLHAQGHDPVLWTPVFASKPAPEPDVDPKEEAVLWPYRLGVLLGTLLAIYALSHC